MVFNIDFGLICLVTTLNKTKLKLLSGGKEMFVNNSFHGTALDTLLGHVKVSKGSFFHHFKSKEDFLHQLVDFESQHLFAKLSEIFDTPANPLNALNTFLNWRLDNYQETGRLIGKLGAEASNDDLQLQRRIKKIYGEYLSYLIKILSEAKKNKQLIKSTPIKELANFILYGLEGGTMSVTLTASEDQYSSVVEMIKRVIRSYREINY